MREITPEIIKALSSDQLELLIELGDLARKEEELTDQIETIRRQEEKVGLSRNHGRNKAIHEDEEFVDLLSLRAVKERSIIRDKITAHLRSLISSGLDDLGIVSRQAANYGLMLPPKE
jgi:hypothetical protein